MIQLPFHSKAVLNKVTQTPESMAKGPSEHSNQEWSERLVRRVVRNRKPVQVTRCSDCEVDREVVLKKLASISDMIKKSDHHRLDRLQKLAVVGAVAVIGVFIAWRFFARK